MAEAAETAAARMSFQLTYARSPRRREFRPGELTGPDIPCAYGGEINASGDWNDPRDDAPADVPGTWTDGGDRVQAHTEEWESGGEYYARIEVDWIDRYANYAVNEGVHEVLEWLRVDGRPWLDPHGPAEAAIYAAVNDMVDRLATIRAKHTAG